MDEGENDGLSKTVKVKKLKRRPTTKYLKMTAAKKAMQQTQKSPMSNTANNNTDNMSSLGLRGINSVPMSMTKNNSAPGKAKNFGELAALEIHDESPLGDSRNSAAQWIEDMEVDQMQLCFENFKSNY